jgi:uncharacterized protein YndB with AHSA1/START domain
MNTFLGKLDFALQRELVIRAPRKLVFQYFTDSERFARWWGAGSSIEPRVGGAVVIVQPGGSRAVGSVLELKRDERVVFTYGYEGANAVIPPAGSRVTITLHDDPKGTRLHLLHEVADAKARDVHVQGWRYQLSMFANVVANEAHFAAPKTADAWFAAWNEPDAAARRKAFAAIVAPNVEFHDAFSDLSGLEDLDAQVTAGKVHMPGITIERAGTARHCQGTLLVDWIAKGPQGVTIAGGTNVFELAPDGRIARVTGLWNPPASG